jgi:hypothetical protein
VRAGAYSFEVEHCTGGMGQKKKPNHARRRQSL